MINREVRTTRQGLRLWETTTEGSPISPFFATLPALCDWAAEHATVFGAIKVNAAEWKAILTRAKPEAARTR